MSSRYRVLAYVLFIVVLVLSIFFRSYDLGKRFEIGDYGYNGAHFSLVAKNYVRHGVFALRGAQSVALGESLPEEKALYFNHPQLLPLLVAVAFAVVGESEAAAAAVPLIVGTLGVALFSLLAIRLLGLWFGLVASVFFAFSPMSLFYGRIVVHEPLVLTVALAAFLLVEVKERSGVLVLGLLAIGALSGWPAYYLGPVLGLWLFLTGSRDKKQLIILTGTPFVFFALQLLYIRALGGPLEELFTHAAWRSQSGAAYDYGFANWGATIGNYFLDYFSVAQVLLALAGLLFLLVSAGLTRAVRVKLGCLLLFGLLHCVLFRFNVLVHTYLLSYLLPAVALLAALAISELFRVGRREVVVPVVIVLAGLFFYQSGQLFFVLHRDARGPHNYPDAMQWLGEELGEAELASSAKLEFPLSYYLDTAYKEVRSLAMLNRSTDHYLLFEPGVRLPSGHYRLMPAVEAKLVAELRANWTPVQVAPYITLFRRGAGEKTK